MSDTVVRIENLRKQYGPITALDDISLEVERGTIFGLLGPNGAGKTTAVKILTTLVRPDAGKVEVAGADILKDPERVRSLIGYVPQELTVDPYLTVEENTRSGLWVDSPAALDSSRRTFSRLGCARAPGRMELRLKTQRAGDHCFSLHQLYG